MRLLILAAVTILAGCAQPQKAKGPPPVVTSATPRCTSQGECARMWIEAQQSAEQLSGMRLRMVTDKRIETFAPTTYSKTGIVVVKYPLQDGSYELRASLECYRSTDCSSLRPLGINAFNAGVSLAADRPWQKK